MIKRLFISVTLLIFMLPALSPAHAADFDAFDREIFTVDLDASGIGTIRFIDMSGFDFSGTDFEKETGIISIMPFIAVNSPSDINTVLLCFSAKPITPQAAVFSLGDEDFRCYARSMGSDSTGEMFFVFLDPAFTEGKADLPAALSVFEGEIRVVLEGVSGSVSFTCPAGLSDALITFCKCCCAAFE